MGGQPLHVFFFLALDSYRHEKYLAHMPMSTLMNALAGAGKKEYYKLGKNHRAMTCVI
jgi:hypothetical protein